MEICIPSYRVIAYNEKGNNGALRMNFDLLEKTREATEVKIAVCKQKMSRFHNRRVKKRRFLPGDLMLIRADIAKGNASIGKLEPN